MNEPKLILSPVSRRYVCGGEVFRIEVYKPVDDDEWSLQVVSSEQTAIKWDEKFDDDWTAYEAAVAALKEDGAEAFTNGGHIIFLAE